MNPLRYLLFPTSVTGFILIFFFSIFVTPSLTLQAEPPVYKQEGCPSHPAQALAFHIWLPFH